MLLWEKSPDFFYKQHAILYQSNSMFNPNFPKGSAAWRCKRVSGAVGDAVAGSLSGQPADGREAVELISPFSS